MRPGKGSLHLAEDPAERLFCRDGQGPFRRMHLALGGTDIEALRVRGRSAVAAVARLLTKEHLVVHCVDLDGMDLEDLRAAGPTVVLCPRSNRYIAGLLPPLHALLEKDLPLAIGTDSLASSPSLAPLSELALLRREFPDVSASRLLPLAWNGKALGARHVGALERGQAPGILAAPLEGLRVKDPFDFLLDTFADGGKPFTWIRPNSPEAAA